jgi:hypothetical protein
LLFLVLASQVFSELEAEAYAAEGASAPREIFMMDGIPSAGFPDEDTLSTAGHGPPQQPPAWSAATAAAASQAEVFSYAPGMDFTHAWAPIVTPARRSLDGPAARDAGDGSDDLGDDLAERLHVHRPGSYGEMPTALAEQVRRPSLP